MIWRILLIAVILFVAWWFLAAQIHAGKDILKQTFQWMYHD